ncbi:hypothetical protein LXL04_017735 [Taraxacum kok-saghyz]
MAEHFILFSVLLLSLLAFSVSDQLLWSVNCGESDDCTDDNLIPWAPDETLVSNGDARVVQSSNQISTVLDSLRVFKSRNKNCYSTRVTRGEQVLVRASFNYGNYDRLSSPPTFDLHFDGNFWTTVETSNDGPNVYEVIYVTKGDSPNKWSTWSKALLSTKNFNNLHIKFVQWSSSQHYPPTGVFANAITVDSTTDSLYLGSVFPTSTPLFMTTYFSEVSNLDITGETRSFRFYETTTSDSQSISDPISPLYGTMIERQLNNYTVDSITNISLIATTNSNLPPIINTMETFNISGVLTDGTDSNDVAVLTLLQNTFDVLGEWSGDPCLPAPYSWDWLNCSNETPPRVTSLFLDSFELSGEFPDISSMDAIQTIDLHDNSLDGEIPTFFGTMSNLQQLNLADNQFSGPIPTSLSENNKLKLNVTGNPSVCTSGKSCKSSLGTVNSSPGSTTTTTATTTTTLPRSKKKKSSMMPTILGTTIPTFILIWIAAGVITYLRKKKKAANPNTQVASGHTTGGVNGNSSWLHKIGKKMKNEIVDNVVPQTFGSPSPFLDDSGENSDVYGQTADKTHDQP